MHNLATAIENIYDEKNQQVFTKESLIESLWIVLRELQWKGKKEIIGQHFLVDNDEFEVVDFLNTISELGFNVKSVNMDLSNIEDTATPCLYTERKHNELNEQVYILLNISKNNINAFHVNEGQNVLISKNHKSDESNFYFFSESTKSKNIHATVDKNFSGWLISLFSRFNFIIRYNILLTAISTITSILTPLYVMNVYDKVITTKDNLTLITLTIGILLAVGLDWNCKLKRAQNSAWLATRLDHILSTHIFKKIILLIPSYQEQTDPEIQIARANYFKSAKDFLAGSAGQVIYDLIFTPIYILTIAIIGGKIAFVPIGVVVLYLSYCAIIYSQMKMNNSKIKKQIVSKSDLLNEFVSNYKVVKKNGMANTWSSRYKELSGIYSYDKYMNSLYISSIENFSYAISIISALTTLVIGVFSVWNKSLSIGGLIALMMFIWRIIQPLQVIATTFGKMNEIKDALRKIHLILKTQTEHIPTETLTSEEFTNGNIQFENVGVKFQGQKDVLLNGISFKINSGELVTISGTIGTGKSTLLKLINGLSRPQMGKVRISDQEISQYNPISLRKNIGMIPKKIQIFNRSIRENFLLANPFLSDQQITDTLIEVEAWSYIKELPNQLDFKITAGGDSIPSSIRFKVILAINILKKPKILLINNIPQDQIKTLKKIRNTTLKNVTVVLVTNRKDLIQIADKSIVFVKKGQIAFGEPANIINLIKENEFHII